MTDIFKQQRIEAKERVPDILREATALIKTIHPESTVILFGSYARGEQNEDSDLDICVLVPELTDRRIDMKVELRGLIDDIFHSNGFDYDIKLYTYEEFEQEARFKCTLQYVIKTEGVILSDE